MLRVFSGKKSDSQSLLLKWPDIAKAAASPFAEYYDRQECAFRKIVSSEKRAIHCLLFYLLLYIIFASLGYIWSAVGAPKGSLLFEAFVFLLPAFVILPIAIYIKRMGNTSLFLDLKNLMKKIRFLRLL